MVAQLKEELLKKERKLTDIRLEALTSQHQLHQMQDAMHKMKVMAKAGQCLNYFYRLNLIQDRSKSCYG